MGSVKDIRIMKPAEEKAHGLGMFIFSDRYSVFDWGEMPDHIAEKGHALCMMGLYFFSKLEEINVRHHCLGVMACSDMLSYKDISVPQNNFAFSLFQVVRPEVKNGRYDYSAYRKLESNFLIPLEVIYRNMLPEGSSVFRRLADGSISIDDLGLTEKPKPGQKLEQPIVEVSTKLEAIDRYLSWEEAREIAGLSENEIAQIKKTTLMINDLITREVSKAGLVNEDGKIEFGFDKDRNLVVVDILGTPDECRFTWEGMPVSKELLRKHYRETEWYRAVEAAKKKDSVNWKSIVSVEPPPLPQKTIALVSALYKACCNEITSRRWFDVAPLEDILSKFKE